MPGFIDLTGERFGRWTVIRLAPKSRVGQTRWYCRCDCGTERMVQGGHLRSGKTQSCGCLNAENTAKRNRIYKRKHGGATHTHRERLYKIYMGVHDRCEKPTCHAYNDYGGRGICVCEEWSGEHGYENFREWSLNECPTIQHEHHKLTLDRIDVNGNYEPSNCRWATYKNQMNNKRNNHRITIDGVTHTISEWADIVGINQRLISSRIYNGWSEEDAVMRPVRVW